MLVVGHVCNPSIAYMKQIAQGSIGMSQTERRHKKIRMNCDHVARFDFTEGCLCLKHGLHGHGKIWTPHLLCENLRKTKLLFPLSVDSKLVVLDAGRSNNRETLDVIPMHVRYQDTPADGLPRGFFHQILS